MEIRGKGIWRCLGDNDDINGVGGGMGFAACLFLCVCSSHCTTV